jgi:hypothetical protein
MKYFAKYIMMGILTAAIISCSTVKPNRKNNNSDKIVLPKVNRINIPGGTNINWHYIGTDIEHNFSTEIDESSIKLIKDNIYKYTSRKTIFKPSILNYLPQEKKYKYHIANWFFDCDTKEFVLIDLVTYDNLGNQLSTYNYKEKIQLKWNKVGVSTIAEKEYNYICLNEGRNIGY